MAADDIEKFFQELPGKKPDLKKLEASLQEITTQLMAKKEYLDNLERTLRESQEEDLNEPLKEIERIRIRIIFLIDQAKLYQVRLVPRPKTPGRDEADVQNFTALLRELNLWLTRPRNLIRERVDPNDVLEVEVFIKRLEDSLKECRTNSQKLVSISPRVQELGRNPNLAPLGAQSLIPQLDTLHRELTLVDRELTDRLQALQEILTSFISRSREPSKPEPELAATQLNRKTKPAPIFVPQPVPAVRKEDALVLPDGSFTNVCSRTDETYSSFPSPRSTIESTFKPIEMSDPRSVHAKSSKHKKPPAITTETYDDPNRSTRDERTPDNEYSAEQVSQKVFDFLEIDEPESLSLGDETIDSRASPIPNEEVIDLDSPRFEYYEEIKFKDPTLYSQSRPVEQHEMYQTSELPESSRRRQYVTQTIVDETGKPVTSTTTRKYYIRGPSDPQEVREYKYVQLFDPNNLDETNRFEVSPYGEQPTTVQVREGTRTVVRTIRRRIIRKVVIINGKETVTEEVVEEPVEETVSEYDRPEITEIEDDGEQEPDRQYYVVAKGVKGVEKGKSESPDSSRSRTEEYPTFDVRKVKSVLRPEAKEFTPSFSLSKSTDISLPQDSSISSDTTKPGRFGFMIRDSPLDVSEHSLPEDISSKEKDVKGVRPQRKKKKKRKGKKDTEEPEKTGDDQWDTESFDEDEDEDESEEDLIEKDGKLTKITKTKTIVVTKDGKSPRISDSSKASKPKQGSKDAIEEIEKMIIVTDDKTRKPHERKDDEKKPTETKAFVGKEKSPVTVSLEKPVERKPKDGKTPIEPEAPEKPTDKETDKKTKDKKGKPDQLEDREKPKTEDTKPKERTPEDVKPKESKEAKPKPDSKKKPEDDKQKRRDDIKVVLKAEDRKSPEKEKLRPLGTTVTETIKFEQEPDKKGKPEVFGKAPDRPKPKFFDISQFIEQEQQPTADEPSAVEQGDKPKPEKPVKDAEPSKAGRPEEKDKTRGKKEKAPDTDKLFGKEVKSRQPSEPKDEEPFKVGQPKGEKDKSKPVDESKAPGQKEQEPVKVSKPKEEKPVKDKPKAADTGKTPEQKDREPSQLSKTKEEKPKPIGKDVTEEPKALEKDKLPKKEEPSKVEKQKVEKEKMKEGKTPEVSFRPIGEVKVEDTKPSEQDGLPLNDGEFKVGKPKDIKDMDKRGKAPEKDETEPIDVSKTVEHKTFLIHEHKTHEPEKPEEGDDIKATKKQDKRKKEKTPEEDKSKPGKEIAETLKFIQFGYRVSPEDERSQVVKPTQDKPEDKVSDKKKPIEVGEKPEQQKPRSEDDRLLRNIRLVGRKDKTPDKDKPFELGKASEQPIELHKTKDEKDKKQEKPDKDKPEEHPIFAPEQPTETGKPKEDKDKKGKKPDKTKPEDFAKAPDQPKSQEPSKAVEKPVEEKDKDSKGKLTLKDKPTPLGRDAFDITAFIEHEKPSTRDTQDKTTEPEGSKPKDDKEREEKSKLPKVLSEDDQLSKTIRLIGRKEKTPDKDKPVELGKAPEQPRETRKPEDDKDEKQKKTDKDKPEELAKAPEQQPKSQEPSKVSEKPVGVDDKDRKGEPTPKDKPSDKDTFDITQFIAHERTPTRDTLDTFGIPEQEKPKQSKGLSDDDGLLRDVKLIGRKKQTPDREKPVELGKAPEQPTEVGKPKDDKDKKEKKPDKDKPEEVTKASEEPKPTDEKLKHEKDKKGKKTDKDKPEEFAKAPEQQPKSQEPSKVSEKPVEIDDKDRKGKPTPEDKPSDKDTFDITQFTVHKKPSTRDTLDKVDKPEQARPDDQIEKEGKLKQPKGVSDDDGLLRDVKLIGRKKQTPDKDKPVELGKVPQQPTGTEKPKDDKDKKGKKSDKDKPEEFAKAPEQQPKSQKPPMVSDKPADEFEKDRKGKPTKKDKTKPSDKDTFDVTEFIAHEKTPTRDTRDKVEIREPEKPKDARTKKEKTPDKDKPVELVKSVEQPKDDKDTNEKPTDKTKPVELDKKPEKEDQLLDEKEKGKKDKARKKDQPVEVHKKAEQPKRPSEEEQLTHFGEPTEKDKKGKTPDKDKPDKIHKAPEPSQRREKPKDDKELKQKTQDKDKPFGVDKQPEQQKLPSEEEEIAKGGKQPKDRRKKEKTPEEDKEKLGKEVTETLKFIQFGYRVSPEDERSHVLKPTEDKASDKDKPIEVDQKPVQAKPSSDDSLLRTIRLIGRKQTTSDKDDSVNILDKTPEQPTETDKPKDDKDRKGKKPDKDEPVELGKAPEQPRETRKPKDDKDEKQKKTDKDKPEEFAKAPEQQPKSQEPSKFSEKPVGVDDKDRKGKPTPKDKPLDKDTFDITQFIAHERTPTRDTLDTFGIPEQEKPKQSKGLSDDDGLLRDVKLIGRKKQTPDREKPVELGKAPEQPTEVGKPKDDKDKKEKKPDKDKPEEVTKASEEPKPADEKLKHEKDKKGKKTDKDKPEEFGKAPEQQPKSQEPPMASDKPTDEFDKDKKGKLTKKDKTKPSDKVTFDVTEFIAHEKTPTRDTRDKVEIREPEKPKDDKTKKEKTPDKDESVKSGKAPKQPVESGKPKDDKEKKGKKVDKDKPEEFAKASEQSKGQEPSRVVEKPVEEQDKDRKGKPTPKDKDTPDIRKVTQQEKLVTRDTLEKLDKPEKEKPKDQKPKTDELRDVGDVDKERKPTEKDKLKFVKREVVETITATGEQSPSREFIEVTKLIEHEKFPVREQPLFKEDEPAEDRKKGKKEKTPDKDKSQPREQKMWEVTKLIDGEKPQKDERELPKVGKPADDKDAHKTKKDKDKTKGLQKVVFGTTEFIQRESTLPEDRVTFKTGKDTFGIVKTQEPEEPSKVGKDKDEKAPEKHLDVAETTETKEQVLSKVRKDRERKEKTHEDKPKHSEETKLLELGKLPSKKQEVIEGKPKEEKDKERTLTEKFKQEPDVERLVLEKQKPTKDKPDKDKAPEEPSVGDKRKDGKKKDKGRKEKTPEAEERKPEEKDKLPTREQEPSALGRPKDGKDKPAEVGKAPQEPKAPVGKDKGKKEKIPDEDRSKLGKETTETLKFIQFGYRVSPEDERSQVVKHTEDKPKESLKGKSPEKDTTKHTIVKVTEPTESIQEPKHSKHPDKVEKDKTQEGKPKPFGKATEDIKPKDGEQSRTGEPSKMVKLEPGKVLKSEEPSHVDKPKEEKDKTKKDKTREDKSRRPVGTEPLESVKSPDEGRTPEIGAKEKTPEDKFKLFGKGKVEEIKKDEEPTFKDDKTRKDKPVVEKEKTPGKPGQPLEKDKPTTTQKGGVDVITFTQHEKSPDSDREPLVAKDVKGKKDKPVDKDTTKEPSLEKDIFDTTKFTEGEKPVKEGKPVDKKDKEPKEKIRDADKPKTFDTVMEQEPSKPGKPKDDRKKEKTPETPKSRQEEEPKEKGRKERTPDVDKTKDIGKVQEQPKEHVLKVGKPKGDKETTEKTSTDVETIPAADKLPSKKQEPPKLVKEEDKVQRTQDKDKKSEQTKPSEEKVEPQTVGQLPDDKDKGKKDKAPKKDKPIQFGKEPEQPKSGEKPKDDKEPFDVSKKPEQQKLPSEEELLKGVKPVGREKEKTTEEDKLKPGKVVTATLKFIQQETYPGQQDEPSEVSKATLDEPKRISKAKSPARDTTKHVIVQITEKIKDEPVPSEEQQPSKVDKLVWEKDKDRKGKPTQKDKPTPLGRDAFDITAFIEHEKPSTRDTQDKTTEPEGSKPKDDKEREEKSKLPKVLSEDDQLSKTIRLIGRKEKTPDKDKSVELGKAPEQPRETRKPKDDKDEKQKKTDKDKPEKLAKAPEQQPKSQEPSKVSEKPVGVDDRDRKGKPTPKDKPSDKDTFDITQFIAHERTPTRDTLDTFGKPEQEKPKQSKGLSDDDGLLRDVKLIGRKKQTPDREKPVELGKAPEQPTEVGKPKDDKDKKEKKPDKDKPEEVTKASEEPKAADEKLKHEKDKKGKKTDKDKPEEFAKAPEQLKQVDKPKDDKERKEKTPDAQVEMGKAPEKPRLVSEDDQLLRTVRLVGRKEKTPDKDKPVDLGKVPDQPRETDKSMDDKDMKGKDKVSEKDKPVEFAKKPEEQKLPSEVEQFLAGKPKDKGKKEKTPDEEKGKLEKGKMETLKFIQQETYPSQSDEPSLEPKGMKPSDKDSELKDATSKFGVDNLETTKLIEHEKPESKKPDLLKFKIVTQGYDEKGEPMKEDDKKKPGETPDVFETTKDGRRIVVSFKKGDYPEDDDSQKKDKKKPERYDSKPSEKRSPETEADKRKGQIKKEEKLPEEVDKIKGKPEETEDKQKEPLTGVAKPEDPTQKISVIGKEPEKGDDKRVREVLIGKDSKPKQEDAEDSFASIVRKGERKTPETMKEKPEEPEQRQKSRKKGRKPKSTTKHDEDLPTDEEEEKTSESETVEKEDQPTDDQTSLTGTIVSMTKKFFGFGGRKEPKPETATPEETAKPSSKPQKVDKAPKKKDKKKEQGEDTDKPTELEPSKVVTAKEKKPEPVGKEKTVSLGWSAPDEPRDEQSGTGKTILFPDKPSDTLPQHGAIPAPVGKKPEADAFGKLVHKPQKPEKSPEPEQAEGEPTRPSAPTYADLFTQTSTPETSPRDTDKAHKTSQTKEYQTTEEGIQTEDDRERDPVREYRKGEEPGDGKQTTEKYQQTSKPQSPTVTTTTASSQTSPQAMSPEERDAKKKGKVVRAKFVDKKSGKSKHEDEEDEDEELESRKPGEERGETQPTRPGEEKPEKGRDEPFGVYVKAEVSVTPTDGPSKSKKDDKKERKRKWKGEPGREDEEPTDNIEVTGVVSVDSPKDLIESESQSWKVVQTPQAEVLVNVKQGDKFVTDFLEGERAVLDTTRDDPKGKKDKKSKKPIKDREDEFRLREGGDIPKGRPTRKESSPESDEYGIDVNVRVAGDKSKGIRTPGSKHRPESEVDINAGITFDPSEERRVRREKGTKPEDDDKYKVSVDVKVKSGETPAKTPGKTADTGVNVPSPETPLEPEELTLYLEKAKTLGQDRSKKMQNMKNNKRGFTWIIPSSRFVQGEPVKTNIKDINDDVEKLRDAIARRDHILIQRMFVYLIRNIDDWLELVEYRIRLNRGNPNEGPNQDKVNELKYLNDEIDGVGRNVRELLKTLKDVPRSDKSDIIHQLRTYVEQLEPQIKEIQETTEMEKDNAVKDLSRWEEFLNGVNNLSVIVTENRNNLERVLDSDGSTSSKLEELEKIELANREYMDRALKLIALAKDLANEFPNQEIPPETYTTLETTKLVQSNLDSERDRLLQLLSLADEYEQTLKEFAQVIEVADNLVESPITITSLQHLQDEMQKHRKFFVNLSHCRAILESLESNLDGETRGQYNSLHTKLHAKASSILDKAASRAQQMAMAASKWTILDKGVRNEQQWLQVAHQRLPDLQQVKSTDYDQYISLYQSLASDTAMHHAKILQLMDVANNLQDIITCVGLERFYDDYLNVILKLQEEIRMSLEKLLAFQDMWTLYEIMTKKLDAWMKATEEDLKTLKAAPDRAKMRQFWELKAQYEVHNRLKQEMGNNFEKAVQFLPIADEVYQRQILGKLEDRWKKLEKEIKGIQDSAMATLSAPDVPVNEKLKLLEDELNELNDTVNDLHGIIKTDEELNLYIERLQVLNERLDTIQEELGRLGLLPATESEKVGYLLGLARGLEQQLLEELNQSHCLREKLLALQKGLERTKRNQNSITGMLDQCGAAQRMGSEVVEQAVKTCENVSADLSDQWQDMMDLRKVLHNLPMKLRLSVSPIGVEREFSQLQEIHTVLEERCASLLSLLRHRLSLWKRFEKQLEKVQQNLEDTDYMVELLTLQGSVDFNRLQTATDRLKDLHDSVAEREDLIKELKELADPLVSSCDPEVASQLNAQVDETVTAWNDTKKNLYEIVDKYKDAVKLWKNYREGRDDIRKWIDQQWGALDILQDKPEEALQHIKECKETLANQKARLDELKKLVAQIAADIGLDPGSFLECEVEDLGKRLEDVKDTLTTLTSVAESNSQGKDDCKDELVKAKKFLGSVQKSLNVVGEDGNTLSTLRDHLLALTKTESQVQNVKERSIKMNEKPHEMRNETSVVEILELWQQVFQETFQQYYRLSAKLVKSQDGAAALQLWQEYLRHVQTFLAGSLPEDYDGLRETQRLCEVHQNLLTSQQSVLLSRKDDPGIRDFSQALQEQFNSLANLHNETLARIMDRHNEVNKRLKLWDTYRHDQSKLLSWLRDMTRDQSRLQLRYIHLRRLPKLLEQIDVLLSRIPQGKAQIQEQKKQQEDIVKFCDEALATSIKMESVATAERINNIEASLKSWKDFLNRVQDLHRNYESELEKVEKVCDEITNELSSPAPVSFSAIQSRLDLCRDLKRRISELSRNIEEANVTYDQLKECLSPYDMKMLSQRLWLIGQRQGDLEHHLLLQILWLEDRLETQQAFNRRHGRFVNWAEDLIKRFDKNSVADPTNKFVDLETRAKRLETEVEIELNLKNREYNALHAMANNIVDLSKEDAAQEKGKIMPKGQNRIDYEIMKSDVEKKIKEVDELWVQLKNLKCARLERKSKLTTTMADLWKRMEDIKLWLISVEKELEAPNVIEKSNKKCIDKLLKDHEAIQKKIETQSGNVGEVLNLCELFLGDPAVDVSGIDTNEFESAQQALEKRWKAVCLSSTERKNRILGAWELLLELSKICKEQEKWLNDREKALQSLSNQADNLKLSDVQKMLGLLEKEKQELESKSPALKILDASYSKLAQESRLPADNIKQLAGPAKAMISKWHNLNGKWKNVWDKISRINKLRDDFIKSQNGSIVMLTNISAKLMQAELIPNLKKRLKSVNELEKELERESGVLRKADETGLELMRTCPEEQNVSATQKMVDEYQIMWKELRDRFADVKNKSLENVESKEIQVSTLAFETDSEVQVDTLPHMDRLTSRDAYGFELDVALRECDQNLTGLEKILRSSEEEMGANVPTHKALAKIIATCTSSVELVQHLNKTLLEDCGMNDRDARTVQVNEISVRFQDLVARAREREKQLREASERGRLTCPICSGRNWQQLENDLWRLEQWIQYAEAIQRNRPSMPESIEALEDVIQAHRELLIDLDSHRSIIVSLNIVGDHLADHVEDEEKARSLRERLKGLNMRWDNVCTQAAQWQGKLQKALIENPEFHDTIDDLFKWLEHTETVIRNSEPVDLAQDRVIIEAQYKKFKILSRELEKFEPRVQSLQEAAIQLLDKGGLARERLNALRLRLLGMRRLIKVYLIRLGAVLGNESIQALDQTLMSLSQEMLDGADTMSQVPSSSTARTDGDGDIDNSSIRRGFRFLGRVFRASLPIQALMLLVLGAATLVPDEYYSCAFSNNARFQSYYPNGPPPI